MSVGREPMMKRIEQQTIAALEDCIPPWLHWKAKIHTAVRGQTARDRVSENDAENERRAELPEVAPANARWMPPIRRAMPDSTRRDEHHSAQGDEYHGPEVDTQKYPWADEQGSPRHRRDGCARSEQMAWT